MGTDLHHHTRTTRRTAVLTPVCETARSSVENSVRPPSVQVLPRPRRPIHWVAIVVGAVAALPHVTCAEPRAWLRQCGHVPWFTGGQAAGHSLSRPSMVSSPRAPHPSVPHPQHHRPGPARQPNSAHVRPPTPPHPHQLAPPPRTPKPTLPLTHSTAGQAVQLRACPTTYTSSPAPTCPAAAHPQANSAPHPQHRRPGSPTPRVSDHLHLLTRTNLPRRGAPPTQLCPPPTAPPEWTGPPTHAAHIRPPPPLTNLPSHHPPKSTLSLTHSTAGPDRQPHTSDHRRTPPRTNWPLRHVTPHQLLPPPRIPESTSENTPILTPRILLAPPPVQSQQ